MQGRQFIALPHDANQQFQKKPARRVWRALSVAVAAAVVALAILSWALFLSIHAFWPRTQVAAPPKAPGAYLACSVPDTVAPLRFATSYHLAWSPSGKIAFTYPGALAVNGANCTRDQHYLNNLRGATTAIWSPDGKYLLVQASDQSQTGEIDTLYILDSNGKVLTSTVISQKNLAEIKPTSNSPYMSSLSGGGPALSTTFGPVWSSDGRQISEIFSDGVHPLALKSWTWDAHRHALTPNRTPSTPITTGFFSAVWSPDGKYIAISTSDSSMLTAVLDARTGALVKKLNFTSGHPIAPVIWSPDGKELAAINGTTVQIVQFSTGKVVRTLTGSRGAIEGQGSIAWSPDGKYIAVGYHQATILNVQTGKEVAHINASGDGMIVAIAWSPDSQQLAIQAFTHSNQSGPAVMYIWEI
jgi:WD40 repeat protein